MGAIRNKKVHPTVEQRRNNKVRINGWSPPIHPLQITAWFFYFFFAVLYFGVMVPMLPTSMYRWLAAAVNGVTYFFHFVIHLTSVTVNPADINLIQKYKSRKKLSPNPFDSTKHAHVIENQFCYICEVTVHPKSKHCSVCNKLFIGCVITAVIGSFFITIVSIILIVAFFKKDSWLY
ncbi:putative palmitoyltransferase ZDHHC1-like isoform X3, partial [Dinothrombium tinctorium]